MPLTKVRCTSAAKRHGLNPSSVSLAKKEGRISDPGHGFCYMEEVAKLGRSKSRATLTKRIRAQELAKQASDLDRSISLDEAATLYGTTRDRISKWKGSKHLKGPYGRVWKGQPSPEDRPDRGRTEPGERTLGGGAAYRANHRPPPIDPNDPR